ncbi:MAG: hypothetical protein U0234_04040 [Sandaracinus sp.]
MNHAVRLRWAALALVSIAGCGAQAVPDPADAGMDAARPVDASVATPDARRDTGVDGGTTVTRDVGTDAACAAGETLCGGACADVTIDVHHCGACDHDCTALAGVRADAVQCVAGVCDVTGACAAGRAHCTASADDGCETDTTTPEHCGDCATSCAEPTPMCSMGPDGAYACASGCSGGTPTRCDAMCVDTTTDALHCGDCATACTAPAHGTAVCESGHCGIACDAGFHDCGGTCVSDADVATCGTSCTPCPAVAGATSTCDGTSCGRTCVAGRDDCDGNTANGCEAALATDGANCGGCGMACASGESCAGGTCHCGAGAACPSGQSCVSGLCCPAGQLNCGGVCRTCCPNCSGRMCGSDGCGGTCGSCSPCDRCTASGVCFPDGTSNGRVCAGGAGRCCAGGGCVSPCLPSGTRCDVGTCSATHCAACCNGNTLDSTGFICR